MDPREVPAFCAWQACGHTLLARLVDPLGVPYTQAGIASIAWTATDLDGDGIPQTGSGTILAAATVYDTPQTAATWPYDDGYNFRFSLPASALPHGGHTYRVEVLVTPAGADATPFCVAWDLFAQRRYGA